MPFQNKTILLFLHYKRQFNNFYEKEADEHKMILNFKSGSPLLNKSKKKKGSKNPKKTPERSKTAKDLPQTPTEEQTKEDDQDEDQEEEEEVLQDEEYQHILHLSRVVEFVRSAFKPTLAGFVLKNVLKSMESKYTKNMPKLQGCAIENIYSSEQMPVVRNLGRNVENSPSSKKEPNLSVTVDQKPNDSIESEQLV